MAKKILIIVAVLALIGVGTGLYVWKFVVHKEHPKPENSKNILQTTASALSKEYAADEKAADAKYLNKSIEVSGTISEVDKNQDGGEMVVLQTEDPMTGVQCALRDKTANPAKGQNIVIVGACSGNSLTGVSLTDCVIK